MNVYENHRINDGRMPFIFHDYFYEKGDRDLYENWHENLELVYVMSGKMQALCNENKLIVTEGEVAVINANYIHFLEALEDSRCIVLIVHRSFCLSNHFDTNTITFKSHICDEEINSLFNEIAKNYKNEALPFRIPIMRARILTVLSLLLTRHIETASSVEKESNLSSSIKRALGYIHSEYARRLSLDEVSSIAGISKYYFTREFLKITGMSFVNYLNTFRCEKAKELLLEENCNIEGVAYSVGFTSASYFDRIFKRVVGIRPSDYIAERS